MLLGLDATIRLKAQREKRTANLCCLFLKELIELSYLLIFRWLLGLHHLLYRDQDHHHPNQFLCFSLLQPHIFQFLLLKPGLLIHSVDYLDISRTPSSIKLPCSILGLITPQHNHLCTELVVLRLLGFVFQLILYNQLITHYLKQEILVKCFLLLLLHNPLNFQC